MVSHRRARRRLSAATLFAILTGAVAQSPPAACAAYADCAHLTGDCCPTADGVHLYCCLSQLIDPSGASLPPPLPAPPIPSPPCPSPSPAPPVPPPSAPPAAPPPGPLTPYSCEWTCDAEPAAGAVASPAPPWPPRWSVATGASRSPVGVGTLGSRGNDSRCAGSSESWCRYLRRRGTHCYWTGNSPPSPAPPPLTDACACSSPETGCTSGEQSVAGRCGCDRQYSLLRPNPSHGAPTAHTAHSIL
jgi:hypothetical protein